MLINQNIIALGTLNVLQKNTKKVEKEQQKLSSGLRINSAADDSAGLAISEKMKALIRGLNQGTRNVQDGISLLNVSDGALSNIGDSLQRIRELLVQKNNDTNTAQDKSNMDDEINQLIEHMDSVANNTQFNTQNLLDGTFINKNINLGNSNYNISLNDMTSILSFKDNFNRADGLPGKDWVSQTGTWSIQNGQLVQSTTGIGDKVILAQGPKSDNFNISVDAKFLDNDPNSNIGIIIKGTDFNNEVFGWYNKSGAIYIGERIGGVFKSIGAAVFNPPLVNTPYKLNATVEGDHYTFSVEGVGTVSGDSLDAPVTGYSGVFSAFGATGFDNFKATPTLTIDTVDQAIDKVNSERAQVGAYSNGLNHNLNNLNQESENMTSALSRISDVDMAKEMMALSKDQVLQEAAQAILAQANQQPMNVLQLLKNG